MAEKHRQCPQGAVVGILGVIGCGKTTLGKSLAAENSWQFLEEDWMSNPYFIGEKADKSSQLEIAFGFLLMRKKQNEKAQELKNLGHIVLLDTMFATTDFFSKLTLDETDYNTFKEIYTLLGRDVASPDIVIYLHGDHEVFIDRALGRNRDVISEKKTLNADFIGSSDKLIKEYLENFEKNKILSLDTSKTDVRDKKMIESLTNEILNIKK